MGNMLSPGCCCGCPTLYLGYAPSSPVDQSPFRLTDPAALQASLDAASLPGHDVTLATGPHSYQIAPGGRWSAATAHGGGGAIQWHLEPLFAAHLAGAATDYPVHLDLIWSPAGASGAEIYGPDSLAIEVDYDPGDAITWLRASGDWADPAYWWGTQPLWFRLDDSGFFAYPIARVAIARDCFQSLVRTIDGIVARPGGNFAAAAIHRPIANPIPRRLHIVNHADYPWQFDGLYATGATDDRTPGRDAAGRCPSIFFVNRALPGNEPFLCAATLGDDADGLTAIPTRFSLGPDRIVVGEPPAAAAICRRQVSLPPAAPTSLPPGSTVGQQAWLPAASQDIQYTVWFGSTDALAGGGVRLQVTLAVTGVAMVPDGWDPLTQTISYVRLNYLDQTTQMRFDFPAWDRGQMPTIPIIPTDGGILAGGLPGTTIGDWPAPHRCDGHLLTWTGSTWHPTYTYAAGDPITRRLVLHPVVPVP